MKLSISEILEKTSQQPTVEKQAEILRKNDNPVLRQVVQFAYDSSIKWLLPPGAPPFKYSEAVDGHGMLYSQARKFYLFLEGGGANISRLKRERLFIDLLESLDPKDADLLIAVKDKHLPYNISYAAFNEAFDWKLTADMVGQKAAQVSPGVVVQEPPAQPTTPVQPVKRGRGRPPGAKNKPKAPKTNQEAMQ